MCADSIAPVLVRIFNTSTVSGKLPMEWKTAHVVPVYKKGDHSTLTNYRPIALTLRGQGIGHSRWWSRRGPYGP